MILVILGGFDVGMKMPVEQPLTFSTETAVPRLVGRKLPLGTAPAHADASGR